MLMEDTDSDQVEQEIYGNMKAISFTEKADESMFIIPSDYKEIKYDDNYYDE